MAALLSSDLLRVALNMFCLWALNARGVLRQRPGLAVGACRFTKSFTAFMSMSSQPVNSVHETHMYVALQHTMPYSSSEKAHM